MMVRWPGRDSNMHLFGNCREFSAYLLVSVLRVATASCYCELLLRAAILLLHPCGQSVGTPPFPSRLPRWWETETKVGPLSYPRRWPKPDLAEGNWPTGVELTRALFFVAILSFRSR